MVRTRSYYQNKHVKKKRKLSMNSNNKEYFYSDDEDNDNDDEYVFSENDTYSEDEYISESDDDFICDECENDKECDINDCEICKEIQESDEKKNNGLIIIDLGKSFQNILKKEMKEEEKILNCLNDSDKEKYKKIQKDIKSFEQTLVPNRIQFLLSDHIDISTKSLYQSKYKLLKNMEPGMSEYKKTKDWVQGLESIPFGIYNELPTSIQEIPEYIHNIKSKLDKAVYGHEHVKESFIEIITKWITNKKSKGHIIGIVGSPGTGKTSIVREGLSKALNRPFCNLSLSGFNDENHLCGFSPTYEGSTYGKIVKMLIEAKCMNPIIFMDELDKIDNTKNGNNIANKLIEITDSSHNHEFEDFYFPGVKIDLSRCLFVFSMNNIQDVNPILRDRIEIIRVNGFNQNEKKTICKKFIIPKELKDIGLNINDILFQDNIIDYIICKLPKEDGVRTLKKNIQKIIRKINVNRFINNKIKLPYSIQFNDVDLFLKDKISEHNNYEHMYC